MELAILFNITECLNVFYEINQFIYLFRRLEHCTPLECLIKMSCFWFTSG